MRFCKKCVYPDTKPGLELNEKGICYACINYELKKTVDWDKKKEELRKIIDKTTGIITKVEPEGTSKLNGINVRPTRNVVIPIISKKPANIG